LESVPVEIELLEVLERAHFDVEIPALHLEQALEDDVLALVVQLVAVIAALLLPGLLRRSLPGKTRM
jgi:hypothetical protein